MSVIKNLEPLETIKPSRLNKFYTRATAAQVKVAQQFSRDYWLVEAVRHINKRDWFLTFERTVHLIVEDKSQVCHVQQFKLCLSSTGKVLSYRRMPIEVIIPDYGD